MSTILTTPKAKRAARENNIELSLVTPGGVDRDIRFITYADTLGAISTRGRTRGTRRATHLAERIAKAHGIDLNDIKSENDILDKSDVMEYLARHAQSEKIDRKREMMCDSLRQSRAETLEYTLYAKIDTTKAFEFYNSRVFPEVDSIFDVMLYAISRALADNPKLNSIREKGVYSPCKRVDLAVAVNTEWGIITPILRNCDTLSLPEISVLRKKLKEKVEKNRITNDDISDGTFTVTNLGRGNVTYFNPIINYPQAGILGIGKTEDELFLQKDGSVGVKKMTYFSLSVDHILIDGMDADEFFSSLSFQFSAVKA